MRLHPVQWECAKEAKDVLDLIRLEQDQILLNFCAFREAILSTGGCPQIRFFFAYTRGMSRYTKATHTVYLHFMSNQSGWHCQFLEADLKTSLPRRFTFASPDKIRELARRGEAWRNLERKK